MKHDACEHFYVVCRRAKEDSISAQHHIIADSQMFIMLQVCLAARLKRLLSIKGL
jgi:hypothetical protein